MRVGGERRRPCAPRSRFQVALPAGDSLFLRKHGRAHADLLAGAVRSSQPPCTRSTSPRGSCPESPVGTVDKVQAQEAPIVFFSIASSSGRTSPVIWRSWSRATG